ncbi:MAG TPA: SxtJ family membrane protein, partial [Candidatus Methylomirabilis sp.]|nr:SxtJ family membrane protein [Candidatus Methylomirabilis sp.]
MSPRDLRRFGLTVAIPLGLLAAVGTWRGHTVLPAFLATLGIILGGSALLAPGVLAPVEKLWMRMAHALGWFNTRLILGLVYFLVVTPTGMVMRLIGRDP